jgi:hypothetical protein
MFLDQPQNPALKPAWHPDNEGWVRKLPTSTLAVYHFRTPDPHRNLKKVGPGFVHLAVVVGGGGECYAVRVSQSKTRYFRKGWYAAACGKAIKKAVIAERPDFVIDLEIATTHVGLARAVRGQLIGLGWLPRPGPPSGDERWAPFLAQP